jgi:hypothetical protein
MNVPLKGASGKTYTFGAYQINGNWPDSGGVYVYADSRNKPI